MHSISLFWLGRFPWQFIHFLPEDNNYILQKLKNPECKNRVWTMDTLNFSPIYLKGAARGGAEGVQAPSPSAIRILMFIS